MDSAFMSSMAELLCAYGLEVVRFEFPYMAERRQTGKRRPPNPMPQILQSLGDQVLKWSAVDQLPLFVAGKSMGGRAAAMLSQSQVVAAVAFGYPLHPAGKPEKCRLEPLQSRTCPLLIVQGDRDQLGNRAEFESLSLDSSISIHWLADGDHDLKPRVKSGFTHSQHLQAAAQHVAEFVSELLLTHTNPNRPN